ncbi:hypothetical protein D9758_013692 [Tetrapyrgos nigripes]|uniref:Uncharacterized protein n=1 Tax=Tetrapyrgos nigripes TaxID=182062 RepID=A0A8H5CJQ7_9AGAR|nr:hypothetical protein D9758_013692 [Tetrapyrgos nigripes]
MFGATSYQGGRARVVNVFWSLDDVGHVICRQKRKKDVWHVAPRNIALQASYPLRISTSPFFLSGSFITSSGLGSTGINAIPSYYCSVIVYRIHAPSTDWILRLDLPASTKGTLSPGPP